MYRLVRGKDPCGLISKNLIGWTGSAQYEASDRAWNGAAYECYLCHRAFNLLAGLNQHLNSPKRESLPRPRGAPSADACPSADGLSVC